MSRFIFDLSDGQRTKLEAHRQAFGLRSLSAAVQHLIDHRTSEPVMMAANASIMISPDPRGYAALAQPAPVAPVPKTSAGAKASPAKRAAGLRYVVDVATGEDQPGRVSVPLVGTFERKPYQKGAKK